MAKRAPRRPVVARSRRRLPDRLPQAAALAGLTFVIYGNSLSNGFVSDDKIQLLKNPLIVGPASFLHIVGSGVWSFLDVPGGSGNYYRPLPFLIYRAIYECVGFSAQTFHLLMVLLAAVNTVLLYLLVRRLASERIALAAGALFAVYPIHTEVVDWVAALPDLIITTLALLGVLWLARRDDPPRGLPLVGHCGLYLLALLAKETGAMLLVLYAGFGFYCRGRGWQELRWNKVLYAGMAATFCVYLAMRRAALGGLAPGQESFLHLSPVEFALSAVVTAGQYLGALFFPVNLSYFHTFYPTSGITVGLLISVLALAAVAAAFFRLRTPLFQYGILWMAAGLLPALNLTGVGQNVFAERYLYLPSAGFCWIAAWAWDALANLQPRWATAGGATLLLLFAGETIVRNRDWRDDFSLFQVTLRQSPTSGWLHNGMAGAYVERNDVNRALQEERMAVEFEPRAPSYRENLGNILLVKDPRAAVAEFQKLVALAPDVAKYHCDLGLALEASGDARQAAAEYERALRLQPDNRDAQDGYRRVKTLVAPG